MTTPDGLPQWWSQIEDAADLIPPDTVWDGVLDAAFDPGRDVDYDLYDTPAEITGETMDDGHEVGVGQFGGDHEVAVDTEPDSHSFGADLHDDDTVIEFADFSDNGHDEFEL